MAMPKAAMDKDNLVKTTKDYVRLTRKILTMEPKAVAHTMRHPAHNHFRAGVTAFNGLHGPPSGLRRFHSSRPLKRRWLRFLHDLTVAPNSRRPKQIISPVLDVEINIVQLVSTATEAFMERLESMNFIY